jgi:hypothetical protein
LKEVEKEERKLEEVETDIFSSKVKSDEDHSVTSQEQFSKKTAYMRQIVAEKGALPLNQIISKPPYISLNNTYLISGDFGHVSFVFRWPVIEGKYFLEFIVR